MIQLSLVAQSQIISFQVHIRLCFGLVWMHVFSIKCIFAYVLMCICTCAHAHMFWLAQVHVCARVLRSLYGSLHVYDCVPEHTTVSQWRSKFMWLKNAWETYLIGDLILSDLSIWKMWQVPWNTQSCRIYSRYKQILDLWGSYKVHIHKVSSYLSEYFRKNTSISFLLLSVNCNIQSNIW